MSALDTTAPPAPHAVFDDPAEQAAFTTWQTLPSGVREGVSQLQVSGLYCAACAGLIESALHAVPGVMQARVNASSLRAEVHWDTAHTQPSAWIAAVERAGYRAVPDIAAPARELRLREQRLVLWRLFVAGFCMMQVMMYATPAYVAEPGEIPADLLRLLQWASWLLSVPVLVFSAGPMFKAAAQQLRQRRIGMDVPVALGLAVTFIASTGATYAPGGLWGHEVYFDSLSMFVFFLLGGRYLEMRARHRAAASLEATLTRLPEQVERRSEEGGTEWVTLRQLVCGDTVRVQVGQAFPADGVVSAGATQADESLLTGESLPVPKPQGSELVAGSFNLSAPVWMQVLRVGADTRFEGITALMRHALTQRPSAVRLADRWAGPFLWGVLLLAAAAAAVWSVVDPSRAVWVAVSVLIVTCPCALSLATPSVLLAATGALARRSVLMRRMEALEVLARIDTVFFDKTGTLTQDRVVLRAVHPQAAALAQGETAERLLCAAAALAAWSGHPFSQALVSAAPDTPDTPDTQAPVWAAVVDETGQGLQGQDPAGRVFRLGSQRWVGGGSASASQLNAIEGAGDGSTSIWFGPSGQPWVRFELAELARPDAAQAIAQLHAAGLRVVLLSGDQAGRAQALATELGLREVHAGLTPQDKLAAVQAAQAQGRCVAMVGDGLNDAPVMAAADVSVAMAAGTDVTQAHADAVLLTNQVSAVAAAHRTARRAMAIVRQNLAWAALYNLACVPLALLGLLPPWLAGLGMAASSLVVVVNSLRAARD